MATGKTDKKKVERLDKHDLKDAPRDKENLDEGIEESMDGSDPPSTTQP